MDCVGELRAGVSTVTTLVVWAEVDAEAQVHKGMVRGLDLRCINRSSQQIPSESLHMSCNQWIR